MKVDLTYPERSDLAFPQFIFPDGQPHCQFDANDVALAAAQGPIDVIASIQSGNDLLGIGLVLEALKSVRCEPAVRIRLNISYLLGARMDRRIEAGHPATLSVITSVLNAWKPWIDELRILDAHSEVSHSLLPQSKPLLPDKLVVFAINDLQTTLDDANNGLTLVIPDAGAVPRVESMVKRLALNNPIARCVKKRDSQTGKLWGFELVSGDVDGKVALIVDDICDGGGTFAGIAKTLRAAGATQVVLCVTHGIFSKGIGIEGIDRIYCTDSYAAACLESDALAREGITLTEVTRSGMHARIVQHNARTLLTQMQNYVASNL